MLRPAALLGLTVLCAASSRGFAQDSSTSKPDSGRSRVERARRTVEDVSRRALRLARRGASLTFDVDSTVEYWSMHDDVGSAAARTIAPVAFWVPVAAVVVQPLAWADEAREGHRMNADYARSATAALAMGFIASRTTKRFVHRARPCARRGADSVAACSGGNGVKPNASFFSEHTMAVFAIASSATFLAQRQHAPNADAIAAWSFGSAGVVGIGRIYQHHHWLSDVVVGALVGTGAGWVAAQLGPERSFTPLR